MYATDINALEVDDHVRGWQQEGWSISPNKTSLYFIVQMIPAPEWYCLVKDGSIDFFEQPLMAFGLCDTAEIEWHADGETADIYKTREVAPILQNFAGNNSGIHGEPYFPGFCADLGEVIKIYQGRGNHGHGNNVKET
jgi:hypothetical protein